MLLPPVCVVCGAPTAASIPVAFGWWSKWRILAAVVVVPTSMVSAALLAEEADRKYGPYVSAAVLFGICFFGCLTCWIWFSRKSMTLQLPVCKHDEGYWLARQGMMGCPFALFVLSLFFGDLAVLIVPGLAEFIGETRLSLALLSVICFLTVQCTGIRPAQIDEQSIILKNVSNVFAKAVGEAHLRVQQGETPGRSDQEGIQPAVSQEPTEALPTDSRIQPGPS